MAVKPVNAATMFYSRGVEDKSVRTLPKEPTPVPQHLPVFFVHTAKGPKEAKLVTGANFNTIYGAESIDPTGKYFNHATRFMSTAFGLANVCKVQRIIPRDAGVKANAIVYLDVLETEVPNYKRNTDGSIVVDANGKVVDETKPTIPGYKIKWILEKDTKDAEQLGLLTPKAGTMSYTETKRVPTGETQLVQVRNPEKDKKVPGGTVSKADLANVHDLEVTKVVFAITPSQFDKEYAGSLSVIEPATGDKMTLQEFIEKRELDGTANVLTEVWYDISTWSTVPTTDIVAGLQQTWAQYIRSVEVLRIEEGYDEVEELVYEDKEVLVESTMYPIFEARADSYGSYYNNIGFNISSPMLENFNSTLAEGAGMYPYGLSLYTRINEKANGIVMKSLDAEEAVTVCLSNEKVINPVTKGQVHFSKIFKENWYTEAAGKPFKPTEWQGLHLYEKNLNKVLKWLFEAEVANISTEPIDYADGTAINKDWYDFTNKPVADLADEYRMINPFICKTSKNVPLQSVVISTDRPRLKAGQSEINMSMNKPIFLAGGSDGSVKDDEMYEDQVIEYLNEYGDENSFVCSDIVNNPESVFYDSGFSLRVKEVFPIVTAYRKDIYFILSTHQAKLGKKVNSLSETRAIAAALNTAMKLYPESEYFGTPIFRGMIMGGAGKMADQTTEDYIPITLELLKKSCRLASASNGKWKIEYLFDGRDNAVFDTLVDIEPRYIPKGLRATLWESNIAWAEPFDQGGIYTLPATPTVYSDDTSILKNIFVAMAICTIEKMAFRTALYHSGVMRESPEQYKANVENTLNNLLYDKFGDVFRFVPIVTYTDKDKLQGYSYHLEVQIYANNSKQVCTYKTVALRASN